MTERKNLKFNIDSFDHKLFDYGKFFGGDGGDYVPVSNLIDLCKSLDETFPEYDEIYIVRDTTWYYDEKDYSYRLEGHRLENDLEYQTRLEKNSAAANKRHITLAKRKKQQRLAEIDELKRLKKKYEKA